MTMDFKAILDIGRQEFVINVRNRWTVIFATVFGVLILSVSYFGILAEGFSGMQNFTRTSATLLNLVLYIIPLVALTMGTVSFTGDKGSMELLFSQPLSRGEILIGKWFGVLISIGVSTLMGFTLAGALIIFVSGSEGLLRYAAFVLLSLVLSVVFLSVAVLVATLNGRKSRAFGVALFLWFFFVIFYDMLAIAGTVFLRGPMSNLCIFLSLFGNPVDMVRVAALIILDNITIFGAAGAAMLRFLGGQTISLFLLIAGLMLWVVIPLMLSIRLVRRQDI